MTGISQPKPNKSKIVLGNPKIQIEKSTKPAIIEQPSNDNVRKVRLPGFKK